MKGIVSKRRKVATAIFITAVLIVAILSIQVGFAANSMESMKSSFTDILRQVQKIGTMFAAVALAIDAVIMAMGSDQARDKARTAMIYVIIAVAGLYLIPAFFHLGADNIGLSWDPYHPGA